MKLALSGNEILDQVFSFRGQHALWMELHSLDGKFAVTQSHDDAGPISLAGPGAHFQLVG